jgi:triosephosphate isomerase
MRQSIVAGNWKMNGDRQTIATLLQGLDDGLAGISNTKVVVFPPAVYLQQAEQALKGTNISLGGQNSSAYTSGAHTGEVAPQMLKELGCTYVILGHSERRALYAESDTQVKEKFVAAKAAGLIPVLCVGETLQEREAGNTQQVVARQLAAVLDELGVQALENSVVAYEPVWAIGTGLTATPEQAQDVHAAIRLQVAEKDQKIAQALPLLYGGSVNASNAEALFSMPDIDGGLVGGASLKVNEFLAVCKAAK